MKNVPEHVGRNDPNDFQDVHENRPVIRVLTIYMENQENPVGKPNGTHHSIWSSSEIMGFWSK